MRFKEYRVLVGEGKFKITQNCMTAWRHVICRQVPTRWNITLHGCEVLLGVGSLWVKWFMKVDYGVTGPRLS